MSDIAEQKQYSSPGEIISKHVAEMTQGLVNRLRGRGTRCKRKATTTSCNGTKTKKEKQTKML